MAVGEILLRPYPHHDGVHFVPNGKQITFNESGTNTTLILYFSSCFSLWYRSKQHIINPYLRGLEFLH